MSKPTKILKYDLGFQLQELLSDLEEVNKDIKLANEYSGKTISDRLKEIENNVLSFSMDHLEIGNFNETFTYNDFGNVIKHEITGDNPSTTAYEYKADGSGELVSSTKTFKDNEKNETIILKKYTYTDGDITGIETSTTIKPADV